MIQDPEHYRFVADSLHGVATVAIHCVICAEQFGQSAGKVRVFDYLNPSLADAQQVINEHEAEYHTPA